MFLIALWVVSSRLHRVTLIWVNIGSGTFCHEATSHYLNQCWLLISEILRHSPESHFTTSAQAITLYNKFENDTFEMLATSLCSQAVTPLFPCLPPPSYPAQMVTRAVQKLGPHITTSLPPADLAHRITRLQNTFLEFHKYFISYKGQWWGHLKCTLRLQDAFHNLEILYSQNLFKLHTFMNAFSQNVFCLCKYLMFRWTWSPRESMSIN